MRRREKWYTQIRFQRDIEAQLFVDLDPEPSAVNKDCYRNMRLSQSVHANRISVNSVIEISKKAHPIS